MNLMDYSVLLEIEKVDPKERRILSRNEFRSFDSKNIYHIGLIDFLEPYTWIKELESFYKTKVIL